MLGKASTTLMNKTGSVSLSCKIAYKLPNYNSKFQQPILETLTPLQWEWLIYSGEVSNLPDF